MYLRSSTNQSGLVAPECFTYISQRWMAGFMGVIFCQNQLFIFHIQYDLYCRFEVGGCLYLKEGFTKEKSNG